MTFMQCKFPAKQMSRITFLETGLERDMHFFSFVVLYSSYSVIEALSLSLLKHDTLIGLLVRFQLTHLKGLMRPLHAGKKLHETHL